MQHKENWLPNTKIVYISMKPSLSRWDDWMKFGDGNQLIWDYTKTKDNLFYLDISHKMVKNGTPDPDIFIEDGLHMNEEGYERWRSVLQPILQSMYQFPG